MDSCRYVCMNSLCAVITAWQDASQRHRNGVQLTGNKVYATLNSRDCLPNKLVLVEQTSAGRSNSI